MHTFSLTRRYRVTPHLIKRNDRRTRLTAFGLMILATVLAAAACAEDADQRSFANDPVTPLPEPTELATPMVLAPEIPQELLPSPEALMDRRGAPSTIYVRVDGALRSVTGDETQVVATGNIAAFDASPGGQEVAVVTADPSNQDETRYSVTIRAPDGEATREFKDVLVISHDAATPVATGEQRPEVGVSWAPQGNRLLLTHSAGRLVDIPLEGESVDIVPQAELAGVFQAEWSPRGDVIGVLFRDDAGRGELALVDSSKEPAKVTVIAPAGESSGTQQSVESFVWKANGSGVLYLQMQRTDGGVGGGRIIGWDRQSNTVSIVATGGQAGPAGSVTWFSLSPDGKAVVYRVALQTDDGWSFNGLFVRSLETGQVHRVSVPPDVSVTGTWWYRDSLVWSQIVTFESDRTTLEIVRAEGTGERSVLATFVLAQAATPVASPVVKGATPAASPLVDAATPVGTPVASPEATPAASPVSATPQE